MNFLEALIAEKQKEIAKLFKDETLLSTLKSDRQPSTVFADALQDLPFTIIAEVKRRSPSLGEIASISDPLSLALRYCQGGAAAISVLTDTKGFGGKLDDLAAIASGLKNDSLKQPVMRKDFIVHPLQLAEAVQAGAHAVLLIASVLGKDLKPMLKETQRLGLEALVEVHDLHDLELALEAGSKIIGVNRRNLKTFTIDTTVAETLRSRIPRDRIAVAESGIQSAEEAHQMRDLGFHAVLVGEALVKASDPKALIKTMEGREICK